MQEKLPFPLSTLVLCHPPWLREAVIEIIWRQAWYCLGDPHPRAQTVHMDRVLRLIHHIHPITARTPDRVRALESPQIPETLILYTVSELWGLNLVTHPLRRLFDAAASRFLSFLLSRAARACEPGTQESSTRRRGRRRVVESAAASLYYLYSV
jgi:hypothetical protein